MLVSVTIILIMAGFIFVWINKYVNIENKKGPMKKLIEIIKDEHFINLIVGMVTTIIGVTLAILITNYDTQKKDIDKTITLISTLSAELKMIEDNIDIFYIPAYEQYDEYGEPEKLLLIIETTPVTPMITMDIMLANELVVTNTNTYTYRALIDSQRSLMQTYDRLNEAQEVERIMFELRTLRDSIKFTRDIIDNEIQYLNGNIKERDMKESVNSVYRKYYLDNGNNLNNQ